jgi:hypothetical protein
MKGVECMAKEDVGREVEVWYFKPYVGNGNLDMESLGEMLHAFEYVFGPLTNDVVRKHNRE